MDKFLPKTEEEKRGLDSKLRSIISEFMIENRVTPSDGIEIVDGVSVYLHKLYATVFPSKSLKHKEVL